ncbi:hypothetical protein ES707_05503 [subsurface metagenome]
MYDFGPLAAQDDKELMGYFHTTKQVKLLFAEDEKTPNCIFVTRPGGGKTALVKWLKSKTINNRPLIFIQPSHTQLVPLDDDLNLEDHRILIYFELYTGIVSELIQRKALPNALQKKCQTYMLEEWGKTIKRFFSDKFTGMSILGCGFMLDASNRRSYLGYIKRTQKLDKVSDLMCQISEQVSPIVVSDDPEAMVTKGLDELSYENSLRIGAYLSVLTHLHSLGCQVLLFIKEHVLQSVLEHYSDSSHFEDRIEGIQWTEEDLMDMLNLRLSTRLKKKWEDVFAIERGKFQQKVFSHLINGPRDLLFICNSAGKSGEKITHISLLRIVDTLRNSKWNEIRKQFGRQWPSVTEFAQTIIGVVRNKLKNGKISRERFNTIVKAAFERPGTILHELRTKEKWINTCPWGIPTIDERLFFIGCLGYTFEKQKVYPWAGRSIEQFRTSRSIFVSPLFLY